jgi:hypothetical protein
MTPTATGTQLRAQVFTTAAAREFGRRADFRMTLPFGEEDETLPKDQSALEIVAYRDT